MSAVLTRRESGVSAVTAGARGRRHPRTRHPATTRPVHTRSVRLRGSPVDVRPGVGHRNFGIEDANGDVDLIRRHRRETVADAGFFRGPDEEQRACEHSSGDHGNDEDEGEEFGLGSPSPDQQGEEPISQKCGTGNGPSPPSAEKQAAAPQDDSIGAAGGIEMWIWDAATRFRDGVRADVAEPVRSASATTVTVQAPAQVLRPGLA